ncbi:MAG: TetR/AcrR family transcriptional regulator [Xanthomonadaceae bacterium]|nr:TetR/AcrR family transcriptional regulator [Xanthomonadaceae bacterium]
METEQPQKIVSKTVARKNRERQERKDRILETTRKLFSDRGVSDLTMQDIADANEYSIGSLYLYFRSKDDIYAALAIEGSRMIDESLKQLENDSSPISKEKLADFFVTTIQTLKDYGVYFDLLNSLVHGSRKVEVSESNINDLLEATASSICSAEKLLIRVNPELRDDPDTLTNKVLLVWAQMLGLARVFGTQRSTLFPGISIHSLSTTFIEQTFYAESHSAH